MKKLLRFIFCLLPLVSFWSCREQEAKQASEQQVELRLVKTDSFEVKGSNLTFQGFQKGKLLLSNMLVFDVVTYDLNQKTTHSFQKRGSNFDEYYNIWRNIAVYNDTTLVVSTFNSLVYYNLDGKFLRYVALPKRAASMTLPIRESHFCEDKLIGLHLTVEETTAEAYLNPRPAIIILDSLQSAKAAFEFLGKNPEAESRFSSGKETSYYATHLCMTVDESCRHAYAQPFNEPLLFVYDLKQKKKVRALRLELPDFKVYAYPINQKESVVSPALDQYLSARVKYLQYLGNDTLACIYKVAADEQMLKDFHNKYPEYPVNAPDVRLDYWVAFIHPERGVLAALKVGKELGTPVCLLDSKRLLVQEYGTEEDEMQNRSRFTVYRIDGQNK
ncbi:MAG: hypothetical protein KatS3mg033_2045 [Thermonema sp.]|uniref:hypothetical protein n=1 Tax=Thermonema sp. TaxID=2231181 RepID=UPI0021DE89FE|nr:hypothetical protein [Thermonema sp.]GIV40245.1 MAG: hypothetical protein KatS3mg033_2045 [Thermonema sp.]